LGRGDRLLPDVAPETRASETDDEDEVPPKQVGPKIRQEFPEFD